jgi:hypothetical protein
MMTKEEKVVYRYICDQADRILVKARIREKCTKCARSKYKKIPKWLNHLQGGCCGGCKNLTDSGCSGRALWCKLWFCNYKFLYKELEKHNLLDDWNALKQFASDTFGWRSHSTLFFRCIEEDIDDRRPESTE